MQKLEDVFIQNPVIAAVRDEEALQRACISEAAVCFLLFGSVNNIKECVSELRAHGKRVFAHVDLLDGVKPDAEGLKFLRLHAQPDGIISTRPQTVRDAKKLGLSSILRIFMIDYKSLITGAHNARQCGPDFVEVMPGVSGRIISMLRDETDTPIVAGGLITQKADVIEALRAGAVAISTSRSGLW